MGVAESCLRPNLKLIHRPYLLMLPLEQSAIDSRRGVPSGSALAVGTQGEPRMMLAQRPRSQAAYLVPVAVALTALPVQATPVDPAIMAMIGPGSDAPDAGPGDPRWEALVEEGRRLFFEETFEGNGRTCGTCHPATHNFTIDPAFIATLPPDDPLFVAEFNPDLAELEDPELMRRFGLILENLDGFNAPPVFRGVPHTLGLPTSIAPDTADDSDQQRPDGTGPVHALGWSADGSPGTGSLREFAVGAVTQHFPKTLNRVPGVDFRLPTAEELDAMEAFQLSLGRQDELDLAELTFVDPDVEEGKQLFNGVGVNRACSFCHSNAGANTADGFNENFETKVPQLVDAPARRFDPQIAGDGGFNRTDAFIVPDIGPAFIGNGTFNTAPLVEAADTPPFFHNNSAATLRDAIRHYTTATFDLDNPFVLTDLQVNQIATFLQAINVLENVRSASVLMADAQTARTEEDELRIIGELASELDDASDVLGAAPLGVFAPDALADLGITIALADQAASTDDPALRGELLDQIAGILDGIPPLIVQESMELAEGDGDGDLPPEQEEPEVAAAN